MLTKSLYEKYEREVILRKTGASGWMTKVLDFLYSWKVIDLVRQPVKKLMAFLLGEAMLTVRDLENMPSPRVMKSHLPFYLLHPELLDTSKVEICIKRFN